LDPARTFKILLSLDPWRAGQHHQSGIIITPLAKDELTGPSGEGYRRMIELCPVGPAGTPDEVGSVGGGR
jgi:hypothetical protein